MKILGFGKDKNDRTEEDDGVTDDMGIGMKTEDDNYRDAFPDDDGKTGEVADSDDNIEDDDYIDWDYKEYDYEDLLEFIDSEDWIDMSNGGSCSLTHFDTNIVSIRPIKRNTSDVFLEITSPPGETIIICGFNQCDIDDPDLYERPHFFTIRCTDDNNGEIQNTTIIGITKITRKGEIEKLYKEFYGDLSSTIDGKLKRKKDRYYLTETIILQGGEKLVLNAYQSYNDISKVELLMMCDRFRKEIEDIDNDDADNRDNYDN